MTNTTKIMNAAWTIARQGAAKFGGSVKSYLAAALQMAWAGKVAVSQKELARELDYEASRAIDAGFVPASSKQCWYIAGLMIAAGDIDVFSVLDGHRLSKQWASYVIGSYLALAA